MNYIAPRAEPLIREIPLSRLALAPENVRKTPPDPWADAELKASTAALGLLENLVVRTDPGSSPGQAPDGVERYAVVAGGRRLKVMQALVEDGVFDVDHPVPCLVRDSDVEPAEVSLAENVVRIAMHPADQVVAFTKLAEAGQSISSIAARFGLSERLVEQRLRLGNAAPELLDAYRAFGNYSKVIDYCRTLAGHRDVEEFRALYLNRKNARIADELLQRGTICHTPVYPGEICIRCLELQASAIIALHDHPSGSAEPSRADIEMTRRVRDALRPIDVTLLDHVIVTPTGSVSFRQRGLL